MSQKGILKLRSRWWLLSFLLYDGHSWPIIHLLETTIGHMSPMQRQLTFLHRSVESSRLYFIRSTSFLRLRHYRETQTLLTHWRDIPVHSLLLHRHRLLPLNRPEDVWLRMSTLYLDVMSYVVGLRTSILFLDVFCYSAVFWLVSRIHFTLYYILFTIGPCFIANSLKSQ